MEAFAYLSVLLSIILGLCITQVLQGYRGLLLSRARVKLYWPSLIWSVLILLMAAQNWWSSFGLAQHRDWTFGAFAAILLEVVLLYMMAALVLPDIPPGERVDLEAHYFREQRNFFGIAQAVILSSLLKDYMVRGSLPEPANLGFHLLFWASSFAATFIRARRFHEILTPIMALVILTYVGLLFANLGRT
jgi:hypothetical protein